MQDPVCEMLYSMNNVMRNWLDPNDVDLAAKPNLVWITSKKPTHAPTVKRRSDAIQVGLRKGLEGIEARGIQQ